MFRVSIIHDCTWDIVRNAAGGGDAWCLSKGLVITMKCVDMDVTLYNNHIS